MEKFAISVLKGVVIGLVISAAMYEYRRMRRS
jgi:hypothetical protein